MITEVEKTEILKRLNELPPEKITEVRDFVNFLTAQYQRSKKVDESYEWSDEDLEDFIKSSRFVEMSE